MSVRLSQHTRVCSCVGVVMKVSAQVNEHRQIASKIEHTRGSQCIIYALVFG